MKDKLKSAFLALLQQPRSSFWIRTRKEPYFRHGKTRRRDSFSRKANVKKVICVIMASTSVFFSSKGGCKFGTSCVFKHSEQAGGEPKKPNNSVVVSKTLDVTQAREEVMSFNLKMKCRYPPRNLFLRRVEKEDIQMRCRMSVPRKTCRRLEFVRKNVWDLHRHDTKLNLFPSM